ncbi:hypothetical protein F4821DRAFT_48906 [Hypoxylon rubiginosum]|uniref:Uncharacterized protein n=1 Tax=Hypoxylon rubiginosum TaxID=110542 RepID=A0ACC0CK42_9PEZI|nr:hypothetical protein F4821DRAFT_48906 [Hypoxylon rubiginosum]
MSYYLEAEEGIPVFELGLSEGGDDGSDFRTLNDPAAPLQRHNITERKGAIDIRCMSADVVHGYMKAGEDPATLIVYEFQFDTRKKARRIATVDIAFTFGSHGGKEPEVVRVSPQGRSTLVPTTQTETITSGGSANAGANVFGADLGGDLMWEKAISRETNDATTIVGSVDLVGRNFGASNAASWTLMENKTVKTGVPAHLRTAILLSRQNEDEFFSTFKIIAEVDLVSRFTQLFGSTPKDDPILYDPALSPTNKLRNYDVANLGSIDLWELTIVSFTNGGS